MKKIGTITFHAAHNYGSNLQAYALQEYIKSIFNNKIQYNIINFRPESQDKLYNNIFKQKGAKALLKKIALIHKKEELYRRDELFEEFINNKLNITQEFKNEKELAEVESSFDYYICGSDQIWNLMIADSSWAYFLNFVKKGTKISYAPSFGNKNQTLNKEQLRKLQKNLMSFDHISVRDDWSQSFVNKLTKKQPDILIDPTMLLDYDDWIKIIPTKKIVEDKYILLYDIKCGSDTLKTAKKLAKRYKAKIISPTLNTKRIFCSSITNRYDCGPLEFLNLVLNAEFIVTSSFHGTVFALLLKKNFVVCDYVNDNRLNTLCKKFNLSNKYTNSKNCYNSINKSIDYNSINSSLEAERTASKSYLLESIKNI